MTQKTDAPEILVSSPAQEEVTALTLLGDLRALLRDPDHWLQGASGRIGRDGARVGSCDPRGTCFCLGGGLTHILFRRALLSPHQGIYQVPGAHEAERALIQAARAHHPVVAGAESLLGNTQLALVAFNDRPETTHADVLAVLDEAERLLHEAAIPAEVTV